MTEETGIDKAMKVAKSEDAGKIKIPHRRSAQFTSHFSTGAIITGEGSDTYNHIIFYAEAVGINQETGVLLGEDRYETILEEDDLFRHREDKARITMDTPTLRRLYNTLKKRFETEEKAADE